MCQYQKYDKAQFYISQRAIKRLVYTPKNIEKEKTNDIALEDK